MASQKCTKSSQKCTKSSQKCTVSKGKNVRFWDKIVHFRDDQTLPFLPVRSTIGVQIESLMRDALAKTTGLDNQPWMKLPTGTWSFFRKCGYSANEIGVLLYFYLKLGQCPPTNPTQVFVTCQEAMDFADVTRTVCYRAIDKMCSKGMVKVAVNSYEMAEFLTQMNIRGEMYINQGAATQEGTE
jgi:hypothetical protein